MSEDIELKAMPLASVIYVATFVDGVPTVQGRIYADAAGRAVFEGDAGKSYVLLQQAMETTAKRLATRLTDQLVHGMEEKRRLNAELQPSTPETCES